MWKKMLTLLLLMFFQTSVFALEMTCDTGFNQLIENSGGVGQVKPIDLKSWINRIKSQQCSFETLKQYAPFQSLVDSYTEVPGMDLIDLINRANDLLVALHSVLAEVDFYPEFETRMNTLPARINEQSMSHFLFDIDPPRLMGGTLFRAMKNEIGIVEQYKDICGSGQAWECERWEKSLRFFAALTYLSRNISEQESLKRLHEFRQLVEQEITIWDSYYETRKPQLPWEMFSNEILHRDIRTAQYFARPPRWDLVLMHPQLVYTGSKGDLSEGQLESQLVWELVGANFWNDNLLSGVSLVTASLDNTDRLGINLILKNRYSIGYLDDDEGTWYLSIDLYDFVADKKNAFTKQLEDRMKKFK